MATSLCERCRVRPAAARVRRVQPGRPPITETLCETCLREGRLSGSGVFRGGPFDELLSSLFGETAMRDLDAGIPVGVPAPVQQIDVTDYFSEATRALLQRAATQAVEWGAADLDTDHLLAASLQDEGVRRILDRIDVDAAAVARQVEASVEKAERRDGAPALSPDTKRALLASFEEARRLRSSYIGPEHLLLAVAREADSAAGQLLARAGLSHDAIHAALVGGPTPEEERRLASTTPTLDQHGRDLTELAGEGRLDPVIGRHDEVEQAIEVLSRRTKNNPVLIGDPGVGKTAIAEGIAQRIVRGDVPAPLHGRRLVSLDLAGLLAGTRYRGEFEQRLKAVIDEITDHADELLLFIDELHTIVGAGAAEGALDAGNMLKPALARGELHVIGATTLDEYRKNVERDAALERRFQPLIVHELSSDETIEVLLGLKDRYEAFHRVRITDEAIAAAARMSDRYIVDRHLPDKAVDLIDQASARVRLREGSTGDVKALEARVRQVAREKDQAVAAEDYGRAAELKTELDQRRAELEEVRQGRHAAPEVTAEDIATVVARLTGIPVARLTETERDRLLRLEDHLHARVVDQEEAVTVVAEAIRRNRAGLGDPDRPIGSFLFLGPTGVGKTELARALAEALFGDDDLMVRFDMSEFQERHTVSRMVGAPPGYVGYEEAGQLTERVRRHPYAVLLLDEVEKAHPDVFNLLLQILEGGRLTDAQGRTVSFTEVVLVMTSNLGADRIRSAPVGFRATAEVPFADVRDELMRALREHFRPELLNRIDDVVVFRPLERPQLVDITRLMLDKLAQRVRGQGIDLRVTDDAVALLAERGYPPEYGARPLRRTIQRLVENELSRLLLDGTLVVGQRAVVGERDGRLTFDVEAGDGAPAESDWEAPTPAERVATGGPSAPRLGD